MSEKVTDLIRDIESELRHNPELEMLIKEGLKQILTKIKEGKKWKSK